MDDVARVVLALETPQMAEEVLHFLDRSGRARVVATAEDGRQLAEAVRQTEPDVVVAEPLLAIAGIPDVPLLALSARESVSELRAAVRAGARGFAVWPGEREMLLEGVAAAGGSRRDPLARRATVLAVHASRGGAGCTFVATHLAQAFDREGLACATIDLDLTYADLTVALGADASARTISDLAPVSEELTWEHVEGVMHRGVVLAPPPGSLDLVEPRVVRNVVEIAAAHRDVVVLHLARGLDAPTRWAMSEADRIVEVLNLDVLSFRASSRLRDLLEAESDAERWGFVVNRAGRSEITPGDVRRVFGIEPLAVIAHDPAAARAQDHGRLLAPRGRTGRTFARLARSFVPLAAEAAA
jgi:Flp pilus assembly CpaE family ATPase